jgi:hypothetical protein
MKIRYDEPDDSALAALRRRLFREWQVNQASLQPLLLDPASDLIVVGPFKLHETAAPTRWEERTDYRTDTWQFHRLEVASLALTALRPIGERYLVIDNASQALIAIADLTNLDTLVGRGNALLLNSGSLSSSVGAALAAIEAHADPSAVELEFLQNPSLRLTVVLVRDAGTRALKFALPLMAGHPGAAAWLTPAGDDLEIKRPATPSSRYLFEREDDHRYRGGEKLEQSYRTLLARLNVDPLRLRALDSDGYIEKRLHRFCTDFILNIDWYDRNVVTQQVWRAVWLLAFFVVGGAAIVVAIVLASSRLKGGQPTVIAAQVSAVLGGIIGVMKALASLDDSKARLALFWNARSDLKDALYRFETNWRDRVIVDGRIAPTFIDDLERRIRLAQKVERTERSGFFATYKSPTDLVDALSATAASIVDNAKPVATPGHTAAAATTTPAGAAPSDDELRVIAANVDACGARVQRCYGENAPAAETARAEAALAVARATLADALKQRGST